ncbi:MAG: hypothetical protein TREMPRED_003009 [Tremellales sp. Tagirdzhanova-0007]|nr:MAG: hypothetical protein TREMPRED_003009 [Tremellales sp. Tagirdzhanova-0007]
MPAVEFDPKNMLYRNMGETGLLRRMVDVSSRGMVSLSTNEDDLFSVGGTQKGDPVKELMQTAFDCGINMFDNAETYADGESEREMGRCIAELGWDRRDIIITTKIFFGTGRTDKHNSRGLSRKHVIEGALESLKNLRLDYVDIVFAHRIDITTPMEEIVRAFNWLIDNNKAFYWGTSEWNARQIQHAMDTAKRLNMIGPIVEQPQYHMFHRQRFEVEHDPLFRYNGMGRPISAPSTIYSPLATGLLTGKYNDGIPEGSRWQTNAGEMSHRIKALKTPEGLAMVAKVRELTQLAEKELDCSVSNLALAWTLKNENVSTCILGATKPEQIRDNVKALDVLPKLTPEIMEKIEKILDNAPAPAPTFGRKDATGRLI